MIRRNGVLFTIPVVLSLLFVFVALANAGGGVNHTVKVKNDSGASAVRVYLYTFDETQKGPVELYLDDSAKFETGTKCPDRIAITYLPNYYPSVSVCTKDGSYNDHCKKLSCESSQWKIKRTSDGKFKIEKD
jgi:hypothetical protein